ncbi:uncharacterized protein K441DRAFT_342354 [Cenococcum geophilum 1.58]|uniref:uncharacterized protein n=1 Tax=Cenococcum geophilum 1.58 TaxID=794803 RepID=UPI00358F0D09|nr:hypothetical protein K441DRAFT_342354 [Cenococcum geophilum 1.58]
MGRSNGSKGRITSILRQLQSQQEAWYEWQAGQDRRSGHSLMGVSEQRPKGIFPPVDVVRACYLGGYTLYYHSRLPWRFFVPTLRR